MTDLFIDTDVIIDFIIDRQPFSKDAARLFTLIDRKKVKGYTSALCYSNLYYILSKYEAHKKLITMLNELTELVGILKVDDDIIKDSLASGYSDFEDAVQMMSATQIGAQYLVTRNIKDYKSGPLPVVQPTELLALL